MTDWETLAKQLKALGVELGKDRRPSSPRQQKHPIESVVEGRFLDLSDGQVFCHEERYPRDYVHGTRGIWPVHPVNTLCRWANTALLTHTDFKDIIFLDTETTGLAGGTGTYAFQIGAARFTDDGFHLAQFFMRHPGEELALLAGLSTFIDGMQAVVTYNGKAFDLPLLNTRYTLMGLSNPFEGVAHFDLLPLARRLWRIRLESRTLGNVENHILGVSRGADEVPGYLIPEMYFEYLRTSDARPLGGVFYHNAVDILSLAGLFSHMAFTERTDSEDVQYAEDIVSLGRFEAMGDHHRAEALYKKAMTEKLPAELLQDTACGFPFTEAQGRLERRWRTVGAAHKIRSCMLLRNWQNTTNITPETWKLPIIGHQARRWSLISSLSRSERDRWKSLDHRLQRLARKMALS